MIKKGLNWAFAAVWLVNGLYCKVLDGVPRHRLIVGRILGAEHAGLLTKAIGVGECLMGVWILIGVWPRLSAAAQIVLVVVMNAIEFVLAPDLLLFGRMNAVVALVYIGIVYWDTFFTDHPFGVEAFFEESIVVCLAAPAAELARLIPPCLALDIYDDKWGFVAVAMVQTKGLRPRGFPKFSGRDFFLIGYRVFVRYTTRDGKRLRGLYILRSETDRRRMVVLGNLFTRYQYFRTDITREVKGEEVQVRSAGSRFEVVVREGAAGGQVSRAEDGRVPVPAGSPFSNWKEARRFAGPMPFTFSYDAAQKRVTIVEGVRENWVPQPVEVVRCKIGGLVGGLDLGRMTVASAFMVRQVPYRWKKGKVEIWNG
jgi:hypothetical protein